MEDDSKKGIRRNEEKQKKLQAFYGMMKRYLEGENLGEEELQTLNQFVKTEKGEGVEMGIRDARDIRENVWNRIEKDIIRRKGVAEKPGRAVLRFFIAQRAAMLILLIGIGALISWQVYRQRQPSTIQFIAANKMEIIQLPDSTIVYLNVESTLSYDSQNFNTDKRRVTLVGEAFFEVKKDPEKPFQVDGGELLTTVRGTSFDVKAYPEVKENVVSVRDGIVEVAEKEKGQLLATLVHNQQVSWDTQKNAGHTEQVDWKQAGGWIDGKNLVLNYTGLEEIVLKFRNYYGMELTVHRSAAQSIRLRGSFPVNDHGRALIRQMCDIYSMKCDSTSQPGCIMLYQ